jgi:competence protein ComEA
MTLKIILGVVIATIIGLVVFQFIDPNMSNSLFGTKDSTEENTTTVDDESSASFTIDGYVVNPGKYLLTMDGATMEDLINAAGGVTSEADDRCYYLEAEITKNESYYIPTKYDVTNVCGSDVISKVNVNTDNSEKLQTISGIGSIIAEAIINYRSTNGLFYTLEGLMNVQGIGNSKFTQIKNYVILHE